MPKDNNNSEIWKYYKRGDIVIEDDARIWGNKLFEINFFLGNNYLPLVSAHFLGKPKINKYMCNFNIKHIKLINASRRPFKLISQAAALRLMGKGVVEAKREVLIRINQKKFKHV